MKRIETRGSPWPFLLVGAFGATAGTVIVGRSSTPPAAAAVAAPEQRAEIPTRNLHGVRPVLNLLAEHLGIPQHELELAQSAKRVKAYLAARRKSEGEKTAAEDQFIKEIGACHGRGPGTKGQEDPLWPM